MRSVEPSAALTSSILASRRIANLGVLMNESQLLFNTTKIVTVALLDPLVYI